MSTILVVEDDEHIRVSLAYSLRKAGHEVWTASTGTEALTSVQQVAPDVLLLDIMLPDIDGFEVCRRVRQQSDLPILMVTARADELDTVVGLELGADDYIVKPFRVRELLARIQTVLRRYDASLKVPLQLQPLITSGNLTLDPSRYQVYRGEQQLPLKPRTFDLLHFFMRHPHQVFRREQLLQQVWEEGAEADTRTIDVHVRWIREQIEDDPSNPKRLVTRRQIGYQFLG